MTSIAQQVNGLISQDAVVRRALEKDIVSMKALAAYLIKMHKLDATLDAVISAIRRYRRDSGVETKFSAAKKVITTATDMRVVSSVIIISVEKSKKNQGKLEKIFAIVNYEKGEMLVVIQGEEAIKIIINERNKDKVLRLFEPGEVISIVDHLAQITLNLSRDAMKTPGIIAIFSTELTMHDVNLIEVMSCLPELMFFVKQKDVLRSYQVLFDLCKK